MNGKYKVLNRDVMKYLAIFIMFWGHLVGWVNMFQHPDNPAALYALPVWMQITTDLSLFCPPVMFFFIADGYKYTRDRKKYAQRLLLFACITQPFHYLLEGKRSGFWSTNVIFDLFFGLLSLMILESGLKKWQRILLILLCMGATALIASDWCVLGVLYILILHCFREQPKKRFIAYTALTLLCRALQLTALGTVPTGALLLQMGTITFAMMAAYFCMTAFYNGKKGKHPVFAKWFFYAFYPIHYIIIYIAAVMLTK